MKSEDLGLPIFYDEYAQYFDQVVDSKYANLKNKEIEKILKKHKVQSVLDMTCGTGSQVFYLAKLGYQVVGSDFSAKLIELAENKAAKQGVKVSFLNGDMRSLKAGQFDAAITIDNAIGHLDKSDFKVALDNIYRNLKLGGIYVFDILNLEKMTKEVIESDNAKMSGNKIMSDGNIITQQRHTRLDQGKGLFISQNNFNIQEPSGKVKKINNQCILQIYTPKQLVAALERSGFMVLNQCLVDSFSFKADKEGCSIITVAKKISLTD